MAGVELLDPTDLYNILNQSPNEPFLADPNYLLLLDARPSVDYGESHVLRATKIQLDENGKYRAPYNAELKCKQHVIVYDSNTTSLKSDGEALRCATVMWQMGSRNPVKVLKGGYEEFSASYPFLRTQKIIFMPRELDEIQTYPTEIIPDFLYLGNWRQGNAPYIQRDLKVKGHINCCMETESFFSEGESLMQVSVEDHQEADIQSKFQSACDFLDNHKKAGNIVLVFSKLGISRCVAIVLAYMMHHSNMSLKDAMEHVKRCSSTAKPNVGFMKQLSNWEAEKLGEATSNVEELLS